MILGHIGYRPKWIIWVSPDVAFRGDSKSGGPKLVPFLIRQETAKYSWETDSRKFDLLHFGWFNLHQDLFFEEIKTLATEFLYIAWAMCYMKNADWR